MIYRGIEYSVVEAAEPGLWKWQFQIGSEIKSGVTATKLYLLASRRAQLKINQALKGAPSASLRFPPSEQFCLLGEPDIRSPDPDSRSML
jgi:hypothetical protein